MAERSAEIKWHNLQAIIEFGEECVPDDFRDESIAWAIAEINRLRTQLAEANEKAANLEDERVAVHTWGEEQKRRRVYYQDIVYAVCNILDSCWPATHVVCGTIDEASDEVQQAVVKLKDQLAESERKHRETLSLLGAFTDPSCYACDRIRREIVHVLHPTKAPPQENTEVTG